MFRGFRDTDQAGNCEGLDRMRSIDRSLVPMILRRRNNFAYGVRNRCMERLSVDLPGECREGSPDRCPLLLRVQRGKEIPYSAYAVLFGPILPCLQTDCYILYICRRKFEFVWFWFPSSASMLLSWTMEYLVLLRLRLETDLTTVNSDKDPCLDSPLVLPSLLERLWEAFFS